jgi:hypothetical protein
LKIHWETQLFYIHNRNITWFESSKSSTTLITRTKRHLYIFSWNDGIWSLNYLL